MGTPVYVGMPPVDKVYTVGEWGRIRCGGRCKDDYARIRLYDQPPQGGSPIKLQAAALASFKAAEKAVGFTIVLTGSWRACSYQRELYAADESRYAPPDKTAHCRGLAVDVSTALSAPKQKKLCAALLARGWHQARPTDEPWHYSFGIQV
jgi:hypothetical protein